MTNTQPIAPEAEPMDDLALLGGEPLIAEQLPRYRSRGEAAFTAGAVIDAMPAPCRHPFQHCKAGTSQ